MCTSVNEVICHGIPDNRRLADGDIVNIDVTVFYDGVHGDTVGHVLRRRRRRGLSPIGARDPQRHERRHRRRAPGGEVNDIGRAIETHASAHGLSVVREFIGHGVGPEFHSALAIPHYYDKRATTELELAMSFTIEPMLNLGGPDLYVWDDDWTALTADGCRSAQFEHTMVVTPDGVEIMTKTASGTIPNEVFAEQYAGSGPARLRPVAR